MTTHAIEQLRAVIAQKPAAPYASLARAYINWASRSIASGADPKRSPHISALAAIPSDDRLQLGARVRDGLKRPAIGGSAAERSRFFLL